MKILPLFLFSGLFLFKVYGQDSIPLDKSPMDMSYFPDQYPLKKFQGKTTTPPVIRVIYSRPLKDGRDLFGNLIKYKEIWRIGANESTEIEFYKDVKINDKKIAKGRYTLFCIPEESFWTFIINSDKDSWGAFKYDIKKDIVRAKVPVIIKEKVTDTLTIYFEKTATGASLIVKWDKSEAALRINF